MQEEKETILPPPNSDTLKNLIAEKKGKKLGGSVVRQISIVNGKLKQNQGSGGGCMGGPPGREYEGIINIVQQEKQKFNDDWCAKAQHQSVRFKVEFSNRSPIYVYVKDEECFKKFDENKDGTVDFNEFYRVLAYGIENQDPSFDPQAEKAMKLIVQLKEIIKKYNLAREKIFENFDKSKDGNLDFNEFTKLCHVIDKKLPTEDIKSIFRIFDKNGTGDISYIEFYKTLE